MPRIRREIAITSSSAVYAGLPSTAHGSSLLAQLKNRSAILEISPKSNELGPMLEEAVLLAVRHSMTEAHFEGPCPAAGLLFGTALSSHGWVYETLLSLRENGRPNVKQSLYSEPNSPATLTASVLEFCGINMTFTTGRIAGIQALLYGLNLVRWGQEDTIIVVACDVLPPYTGGAVAWAVALVIEPIEQAILRGHMPIGRLLGGAMLAADPETVIAAAKNDSTILYEELGWKYDEILDGGAAAPLFRIHDYLYESCSHVHPYMAMARDGIFHACMLIGRFPV